MKSNASAAISIVTAAAVLCGAVLLTKMHQNARDHAGEQIAHCLATTGTATALYAHLFYVRPVLIAWRCTKD